MKEPHGTPLERLKGTGLALLLIAGVLLLGTLGYVFIEGWPVFDAFYMTAITITTVGFGETHPLSQTGRVLTLVILFFGLGLALFALMNITTWVVQGEMKGYFWRRRMEKTLSTLTQHTIVAGFGRMGRVIVNQLLKKGQPVIVIDSNPKLLEDLQAQGILHLEGDASDETLLKKAGIERAKGFVSVVSNDADNAFAVMTARGLNSTVRIVTRAIQHDAIPKLKLAGANKVIAPYHLSANRIAQAVMNPAVVDFVEVVEDEAIPDIEMADIEIIAGSMLDGALLESEHVKSLGIMVVGIKKPGGHFQFHPRGKTKIHAQDHLVVVGPSSAVETAAKMSNI